MPFVHHINNQILVAVRLAIFVSFADGGVCDFELTKELRGSLLRTRKFEALKLNS
jgi:hypothetical protein